MLLKKISLTNFRQFYGKQEISIATDKEQNVTLVHAENGVGKTTFLNALLWCFYKNTTARFENPELIVNNAAAQEGNHEVSVEILFEHEGEEYLVSRTVNEKYAEETFNAFVVQKGNFVKLDNPNAFIESVTPREMARYFFFDGEYAETFSSQNNKSAVRVAVESMLGCNTALSALKDLKGIKAGLEKEISVLTKGDQSSTWQEKIDTLSTQNDKDRAEISELEINLEAAREVKKEIMDRLRNAEGAKEIQEKRDKLQLRKDKTEKNRLKLDGQLTQWVDGYSIGFLSKNLIAANLEIFNHANIKGLIPSRIAETFVKDILETNNCICHRPFQSGSKEETAIKSLLREAGTAVVNDRLHAIRERVGALTHASEHAFKELTGIQSQLSSIKDEITLIETEVEDCSTQLQGSEIKEIAERERALEAREKEITELIEKITRLRASCENRDQAIEGARQKRDRLLAGNTAAQGISRKMGLLDATIVKLTRDLDEYRNHSRDSIMENVNDILRKTARRDYYAQIDEQFSLDMFYGSTQAPVSKSSGENQLLSLAFIASLIKFGADRKDDKSHLLKPGTTAPLMLDSPFGQLDPSYRKSTAEFLPKLSDQVILLVSKTQGDDDVIEALGSRVGSEYVLISENKEPQGDKPSDIIQLKGKDITCSLYNCERTMTKIKKIV
jgi:DNA sulfur modification protein DndD